jgi:hypothetical protein
MRYRLTRSAKKKRAQVMTPPALARRVVGLLSGERESWLELGSGTGNLARACLEGCNPAAYIGVELDGRLMNRSPMDAHACFLHGNVLTPGELTSLLGAQLFSRVVGNPPYGMQALGVEAQQRLAELCPGVPQVFDWVQLDLYFMLESLARLRRPGEAAFIVGAPIAEDARLVAFRDALMSSASEVECFELPIDAFDGRAEVQSFVLVARFGASKLQRVRLGKLAGNRLDVVAERWVTPQEATHRLDFAFHAFQALSAGLRGASGCTALQDLGASVIRGSRTRAQFDQLGISCFHTSDFPQQGLEVQFGVDHDHGFQVAATSDILLPRVGTRCLGRQALVTRGQRHYTEAVYRLRVPRKHHARVADWVLSEAGTRWRQAAAKGSCAKHITVATLMQMPVPART